MTKAKTAKTAADAGKSDVNENNGEPASREDKKPADKHAKADAASVKTNGKKSEEEGVMSQTQKEVKPATGFSNSGLGIKVTTKKPALSVAPGVRILGRANPSKQEQTSRPSDRRLSKKEQQEIKNFLLEKRERLLAGMRRELAMQKERAESKVADEVDKATDAYDEDLSFEIATANDQELEDIQIALEKIDKGTYGECEICGCSISPSRLKILPSATTCVDCRGQEEQARRRDDGSPTFSMMGGEEAEADVDPM